MVNTILLIIILVVFSILMFLVYAELKALTITIDKAFQNILKLHNIADTNNKAIEHLLNRFNKRILVNEEYFNIIKNIINSRFNDLDNATNSIYDRFNTTDSDIENLIIAEHRLTRRQIEKQAKISSKINSKRKQSNNTQK